MEAGAMFDMSAFGPCPVVHSVCLSSDGAKLLVGVKGCEVRKKEMRPPVQYSAIRFLFTVVLNEHTRKNMFRQTKRNEKHRDA